MTHWMHPPERARQAERDQFDAAIEGLRHGLSRELSLAVWERACAETTDGPDRRDIEEARRRFHEIGARWAARRRRAHPEPGRVTRVGLELDGHTARGSDADELASRAPGRETLVAAEARRWAQMSDAAMPPRASQTAMAGRRPMHAAIQARFGLDAEDRDSDEARSHIREAAERAVAGGGGALPYREQIQAAFGHHDISHIEAHVDATADAAMRSMGAEAIASGTHIAFAGTPSLFTAAHEAAHVVQQAAGVEIAGGVGHEGDRYERHADEVAERVVRGQSVVDLLDGFVGPHRAPSPREAMREPRTSEPRTGEPRTGEPRTGEPRAAEPRTSEPRAAEPRAQLTAPTPRQTPPPAARAARPVQLRRIPPNVEALLTAVGGAADGVNFDANAAGVERLIERAMAELTAAQRATVLANRRGALTEPAFLALPRRERLSRHCRAIIALVSTLELGDPALMNTAPTGVAATSLTTLVGNANTRFDEIAAGTHDAHIDSVFGSAHRATAKTRYANAKTRMNQLHTAVPSAIVTDRSGYNREAGLGGLTGADRISLSPTVIDNPALSGSIITMMHESMHAGNPGVVTDHIYVRATGFDTADPTTKLTNAAHYEVPLWRVLAPMSTAAYRNATPPPDFQEFVPAGAVPSGGGAPTAARTTAQDGALGAYNRFREGWTLALNLHNVYQQLLLTPAVWTGARAEYGGAHLNNSIPFWSKVCKLTIHEKTTITPGSADPAARPVSQIDMALSEGLVRRLSLGKNLLHALETDAQITAYMAAATAAERAAATTVATIRDLLVRLTIRNATIGPITGIEDRDFRAITRLATMPDDWAVILAARAPASFAD
jgi:hypothetical protein